MTLDEFEYLIDVIYAAGVEPKCWPDALSAITRAISGSGAALHVTSAAGGAFIFGAAHEIPTEALLEYEQYYYAYNPAIEPLTKVAAGCVVSDRALLPGGIAANSEYQNDYGRRYDIGGSATSVLAKNQRHLACLGVLHRYRGEPFSEAQLNIFRRLTPHLQRAVDLNRRLIEIGADGAALSEALDCLEVGVALLDEQGRLVYANAAAGETFRRGDGLSVRGRRLSASDPTAGRLLGRLVREAAEGVNFRGGILAVPRLSDCKPYSVRVAALHGEEGPFAEMTGRRVIVFVVDPEAVPRDAADTARAAFKLTPAEAQLAVALGRGDELRDIADLRQVNVSTLRAQLKSVMAKTDTNRQAEVAALMARLAVLRGEGK